jgi:hypothetical protein
MAGSTSGDGQEAAAAVGAAAAAAAAGEGFSQKTQELLALLNRCVA